MSDDFWWKFFTFHDDDDDDIYSVYIDRLYPIESSEFEFDFVEYRGNIILESGGDNDDDINERIDGGEKRDSFFCWLNEWMNDDWTLIDLTFVL